MRGYSALMVDSSRYWRTVIIQEKEKNMNETELLRMIEDGEVSIETLVEVYLVERARSQSVYRLVEKLEKINDTLRDNLNSLWEYRNYCTGVIEFAKLLHGNGDRWKAILKHIYDDLKDTNDGGEYVEIKKILYVPSPVAPDPWLERTWKGIEGE